MRIILKFFDDFRFKNPGVSIIQSSFKNFQTSSVNFENWSYFDGLIYKFHVEKATCGYSPGRKFWGSVFVSQVRHLWFGFEFGKFPLKMANFSIFFFLGQKKSLWVG